MKIEIHIYRICLFLIFIVLLHSCKDDREATATLERALSIAENHPKEALALLDSIANPEKMEKDNYMKYIVIRVYAKYKSEGDIKGDTLIFDARRYFNQKGDAKMATLANLYTGNVYYERKMPDKALDAYLDAEHYGRLCNNNLMLAKTLNNIANIYYEQDVLDSAIVRHKIALDHLQKTNGPEDYKLIVIKYLALSFSLPEKYDSSYVYAIKGLELANKINDTVSQGLLKHQIGIVLRKRGEYTKAAAYLNDALKQIVKVNDSLRCYLSLLNVYNIQQKTDSAGTYAAILKGRLSDVTFNINLKYIYGALAEHARQCADYQEAFRYMNLREEVSDQITKEEDNSRKLFQSVNSYREKLKRKEAEHIESRLYLLLLAALLFIVVIILIGYNYYLKHKKEAEKNRSLKIEYELLETQNKLLDSQNKLLDTRFNSLKMMYKMNQGVVNKWNSVNEEIEELASQYGVTDKPLLFVKIEEIIKSLESDINKISEKWVYDYLSEYSIDEKAIAKLNKNEILLLLLCGCKYTKEEMGELLSVSASKIYPLKLDLKHKLKQLGVPEVEINRILSID